MFAVSYDPVPVLAAFADEHGIDDVALLSDEGSRVIRALGLWDHRYDDRPPEDHHVGVARAGTFLLDGDGMVVEKRFEEHHRWRPSAPSLFEDLVDEPGNVAVSGTARTGPVQVAAWLAEADYRPQEISRVGVTVTIEEGFHVYASPTPPGYTGLKIALEPLEAMVTAPAVLPAGVPFAVESLPEQFTVHEGTVRAQVPFRVERDIGHVTLRLHVEAQACDDRVCFPPATLEVALPLEPGPAFAGPA